MATFSGTYPSNSQSEDLGKYLHLLKPLRALADNWDIDVATELSEYVDIIERTQLTAPSHLQQNSPGDVQGSQSTAMDGVDINFAQAALLIQNSASIYSRKVQYLFNLTQETHHYIFSNNVNKLNGSKGSKKSGDQDEVGSEGGCVIEYQCLDDCLIQKDFILKQQQDDTVFSSNLLPEMSNLLNVQHVNDKQSRELFSMAGESVGWFNEFDLFASNVDQNGMPLTAFLKEIHAVGKEASPIDTGYEDVLTREAGFEMTAPMQDFGFDAPADIAHMSNNDAYDHDDFAAPYTAENISIEEAAATTENAETREPPTETQITRESMESMKYQLRSPVKKPPAQKKEFDFWKLLDAHEESKGAKPFKKGKIGRAFNIVQKAIDAKSQNVDLQKFDSVVDFFAKNSSASSQSRLQVPKDVLKKLKHVEFYTLYAKEQQKRQEFMKKLTAVSVSSEAPSEQDAPENDILDIPVDNFAPDINYDDAPDGISDQDDIVENNYADFHQEVQIEYEMATGGGSANPSPVKSYKEMFSLHAYAAENLHIDEEAEAKMVQRVKQWEERLVPILEEQKARPEYDIDVYRVKVHDLMSSKVSKSSDLIPFERLSEDVPRYDVSRYFLTLLHMANEGKVAIDAKPISNSNILETHQVSFKLLR